MKLILNREFACRHLGVALLMTALSAWFCYDGAIKYPALDDQQFRDEINHGQALKPDTRQNAIDRQFQFAGLSFLAALVIAFGVWRAKRRTLEWDDESLCGSLTNDKRIAFTDVASLDRARWDSKGILIVHLRDGQKITLDAWHHEGVKVLADRLFAQDLSVQT